MDLKTLALKGVLAQNAAATPKGGAFPTGDGYLIEPKFDGWRILADVGDGVVHFYSRSGKTYDGKLPLVEKELLKRFPTGSWLDGEAVAISYIGANVVNDWSTAQTVLSKVGPDAAADKITFMVFDLLAHRGIDARALPLAGRRKLLEAIFEGVAPDNPVRLSPMYEATEANYAMLVEAGYEGAVIKALAKPYASNKREGAGWTKAKAVQTDEFVVMGAKPGENGFKGLVGALVFGQYDEGGVLVECGRASGMDMRTRCWITEHLDEIVAERRVIEVAYMGKVKDGLRHPQFKRWRPDRSAESVMLHA